MQRDIVETSCLTRCLKQGDFLFLRVPLDSQWGFSEIQGVAGPRYQLASLREGPLVLCLVNALRDIAN